MPGLTSEEGKERERKYHPLLTRFKLVHEIQRRKKKETEETEDETHVYRIVWSLRLLNSDLLVN